MQAKWGAILAVVLTLSAAGDVLQEPMHVRFRLIDGVSISGKMTAWDREGFDGTFGRRFWVELAAEDVWRLYGRLIDVRDAAQWVELGRTLLLAEGGDAWAERAFRQALASDPEIAERIAETRREADEIKKLRVAREEAGRAQRLETRDPQAAQYPPVPWPVLRGPDRAAATETMRSEANAILLRAGQPLPVVQTPHLLLYSDADRLEAARLAAMLDRVYVTLGLMLGVADTSSVLFGRVVVFVFAEQDRFRLVEAESFNQLVSLRQVGLCHAVDGKVFLNSHLAHDRDLLDDTLVREAVHGFLHRYQTPRRLPPWANEGLAAYVSGLVNEGSYVVETRRSTGVEFIRGGGDVAALLEMDYGESWPGPDGVGEAVGQLLIELMIDQQPVRFVTWVGAVKQGKAWDTALAEDFGVPPARLVETATAYYRVND